MARVTKVTKGKQTPSSWQEAMEQYLAFKQAQGLRPITIRGHRDVIRLFFKRHPEAYPSDDPRAAVYAFMGEDIKPATYNIRRNYLKQFFNWAIQEGIYQENPLDKLKKRRDEGRVVILEGETLSRLLDLPDRQSYAGLRDYTLLLLTLDTGIRPKEALSLMVEDINLRALEVYVRSEVAKTKVSRTLPISSVTATAIKDLMEARHPEWGENTPIFSTTDGNPMTRDTWSRRMQMYSCKLGVKVKPYDLRHAFALEYLRNGGNALALQRIMGHTDLNMTKRYVALTHGDLKEQHNTASPVIQLIPTYSRMRKAI